MGYKVDYGALRSLTGSYSGALSQWSSGMSSVMGQASAIVASTNISGNSATRLKTYLDTAYSCISTSLTVLLELFQQNFQLYMDAYSQQVDAAGDAHIEEEELSERHSRLEARRGQIQQVALAAENAVQGISDLVSLPSLDFGATDAAFGNIFTSLDNLNDAVNGLESAHVSADFSQIDALIASLDAHLSDLLGQSKEFKISFSVESYAALASVPALVQATREAYNQAAAQESSVAAAVEKLEIKLAQGQTKLSGGSGSAVGDTDAVNRSVAEFEREHPEYAALMNRVLSDSDLTEQERIDIKYTSYHAPEPYRLIYFEHLSQYVVSIEKGGAAYYPREGIIRMGRKQTLGDDPRGAYTTFFHESGHAIDDFEYGTAAYGDGSLTNHYSYDGRSLHDLIVSDTRTYVENYIDNATYTINGHTFELNNLTPEQKHLILKSLNLTDDAPMYDYENDSPKEYYNPFRPIKTVLSQFKTNPWVIDDPILDDIRVGIREQLYKDISGWDNESASDVFGGVTNNAIRGDVVHTSKYYWYDADKTPKGSQERELWAEFFAAQMTHDEAALESIRSHFPQAYEAMEAMAREMAGN